MLSLVKFPFQLVERASASAGFNGTTALPPSTKQYLDYHDLEESAFGQQDYGGYDDGGGNLGPDGVLYNNPADLQMRRPGFEKFREHAAMFNK